MDGESILLQVEFRYQELAVKIRKVTPGLYREIGVDDEFGYAQSSSTYPTGSLTGSSTLPIKGVYTLHCVFG